MALAIVIDNVGEALSIGELIRSEGRETGRRLAIRLLGCTGVIGAALLGSGLAEWFLLRWLPAPALGFCFAVGAGGMFYLTITDLVPDAAERQYQQSGAVAAATGFAVIFALSQLR